jgi:hypothetical protein
VFEVPRASRDAAHHAHGHGSWPREALAGTITSAIKGRIAHCTVTSISLQVCSTPTGQTRLEYSTTVATPRLVFYCSIKTNCSTLALTHGLPDAARRLANEQHWHGSWMVSRCLCRLPCQLPTLCKLHSWGHETHQRGSRQQLQVSISHPRAF